MRYKSLVLLAIMTFALMVGVAGCGGSESIETSSTPTIGFDVRTLTPAASPLLTPPPWPPEAQQALQYISEQEGIPVEGLLIVYVNERTFPLTDRVFHVVTILDIRTADGQEYNVLVDLANGHIEEDVNTLEAAEAAAYQAKYGRLDPSLYERLQEVDDDYLLSIAVWLAPAEDAGMQGQSLVDDLEKQGFAAEIYDGTTPSITAVLPKRIIVQLAERDDVEIIYLSEDQDTPLDTTIPTIPPGGDSLSFETIERLVWSGNGGEWEAAESGLMVMATPDDLVQIDNLFTEDAQAQLRKVDFGTYFAVAVFLGWQSGGHEGLDIRRIIHQGDEIVIYVQIGNPEGSLGITSPYHLVNVRKEGNWNQTIHFTLYMDGAATVSLSHFIP